MTKKRATPESAPEADCGTDIEAAIAAVEKSYGGVVKSGQSVIDAKRMVIPVCPSLDLALGGGITEGSWVSASGPESLGKTVCALSFAANCQRPEYGSRPIFYYAVEGRLKSRDLRGIRGLDTSPSKFHVVASEKGNILSSTKYLNVAGEFLSRVPGSVHIIDSLSALLNPKILEEGLEAEDRGAGYKIVGKFCDINSAVVPINNCIVFGIVHLIANTGAKMGAPAKVEKASNRWKYQADVWLQGKWAEPWRVGADEDAEQIGQMVHWTTKKTALDVGPGRKCKTYLRYGVGLDRAYELLVYGKDFGLIGTAGAWVSFDFLAGQPALLKGTPFEAKGEVKVQGLEKAYQLLDGNPEWLAALQTAMHQVLS